MSDSISIPADLLAETRRALDAALRLTFTYGARNDAAAEAAKQVHQAKAKIDACLGDNSDRMSADKKQAGYHLLRRIDELKREIKKDYGLEK
jgi:hypothetical protein